MLSNLLIRLRALVQRKTVERELDDEMRFHFDQLLEKLVQSGLPFDEARRLAGLEFGGFEQVKEECRDARGTRFLEALMQDIRYSLRMLGKSHGFTTVALLTLALAIGANTALFSVVNGVLLNPLPYPHPEQLITIHESKVNFATGSISFPNFRDWRDNNRTFSAMAVTRGMGMSLTGLGEAERVRVQM